MLSNRLLLILGIGFLLILAGAFYSSKSYEGGYWNFQMEDLTRAQYARDILLQNSTGKDLYGHVVELNIPKSEIWNISDFNKVRFAYITDRDLVIPCIYIGLQGGCNYGVKLYRNVSNYRARYINPGFADFDNDGRIEPLVTNVILFYGPDDEKHELTVYSTRIPASSYAVVKDTDVKYYVLVEDIYPGTDGRLALYLLDLNSNTYTRIRDVMSGYVYGDAYVDGNVIYSVGISGTTIGVFRIVPKTLEETLISSIDLSSVCSAVDDVSFIDDNRDLLHVACTRSGYERSLLITTDGNILQEFSVAQATGNRRVVVLDKVMAVTKQGYGESSTVYVYDLEKNRVVATFGDPMNGYRPLGLIKVDENMYVIYRQFSYTRYSTYYSYYRVGYYDRSTGQFSTVLKNFGRAAYIGYCEALGKYRYPDSNLMEFTIAPDYFIFYTNHTGISSYLYFLYTYSFFIPASKPFIVPFTAEDRGDHVTFRVFVPFIAKNGSALLRIYYGDFPGILHEYNRWIRTRYLPVVTSGISYVFAGTYTGTNIEATVPSEVQIFDTFEVTATLTDTGGTPLSGRELSFYTDNTLAETCTTDDSGTCSVILSFNTRGSHTVTVSFPGDSVYLGSSRSYEVGVVGLPVSLSLSAPLTVDVNEPFTVEISLSSDYNYDLNGTLILYIDNYSVAVFDYNGSPIAYEVNGLPEGAHTIVVSYSGNEVYEPKVVSTTVYVGVSPPPSGGGGGAPAGGGGGGAIGGGAGAAAPVPAELPETAAPTPGVQPASPAPAGGVPTTYIVLSVLALIALVYFVTRK